MSICAHLLSIWASWRRWWGRWDHSRLNLHRIKSHIHYIHLDTHWYQKKWYIHFFFLFIFTCSVFLTHVFLLNITFYWCTECNWCTSAPTLHRTAGGHRHPLLYSGRHWFGRVFPTGLPVQEMSRKHKSQNEECWTLIPNPTNTHSAKYQLWSVRSDGVVYIDVSPVFFFLFILKR